MVLGAPFLNGLRVPRPATEVGKHDPDSVIVLSQHTGDEIVLVKQRKKDYVMKNHVLLVSQFSKYFVYIYIASNAMYYSKHSTYQKSVAYKLSVIDTTFQTLYLWNNIQHE